MSCESLQYLSIGGEKLVPMEPPKDYKFFNAYGPTECTIFTTVFEVDKYYSNIPIGKALDNFKLYIADKFGHLLPYGACGELMISGWQVSRGYLNKPEKTSEVYTKNIYDDAEGYEVVAINDLTSPKMLAHLLKYDSTQGRYEYADSVEAGENSITVNGKEITIYAKPNPEELPWGELDVDVVLECTGFFASKAKAEAHIKLVLKKLLSPLLLVTIFLQSFTM